MTKEIEDPTIRSNVFPRSQLQGDGLLYVPKDENATKRPKPAPIVNIHKEYAVTHSYEKTRQTIKEIITQHKAKALSNQERYVREQEAEMYKTAFLETRLATTGVPTLNTISVVMERRRAQGESQMKGLTSDTPTQAESIQMALQRSYGSGKLDIKSLAIDELPDAISSTFILQMARFITEVNVSRNEFRELSRQFCDAFPGCHTLNASENNIKSLAPEISRWTNLSSLILDYNRLDALPDILPSTLTNLSAARNRISSLPYMYRLSDLTAVDISNNQLVTLPNAMYELKLIRSFNCSRNKLISAALLPLPSFKSRHAKFSRDKTTDDDDIDKPGLRTRDWTQTIDPFTKQPVYYNRFTCETTRVRPAVLGKESTTTLPQIPKLHLPTAITEPTVDRVQQAKEFPGGWEIIFGIPTRFINHATGETVTRIPQELDRYGSFIYMKKLNLAGNQIQELPASMGELYQLETLEIEHNQLVTLPDAIGNLKSLTVLRLGSNYLTSLPKQFSLLPKLKELDVKLNRLAQLPDDIGNMTALTHIDASSNSLISVPPSVLLLRNLIAFNLVGNPNLKVPSASSQKNGLQAVFWEIKNQIHIDAKGMPPEPIQVTNGIADECVTTDIHVHKRFLELVETAKTSHVLNFHWRNLSEIPYQLYDLAQLIELRLTGHCLGSVPIDIARLTCLRVLTLRKNQLKEFPSECIIPSCPWEELDCENNQLSSLPHSLKYCSKLRVLRMGCNVLESLPPEIGSLNQLEHCLVPHNHLRVLPDSLAHVESMKILDVSNNSIEDFNNFDFASLKSLVDFRANLNLLSDLPESIGQSNLLDLALSGNQFNVYPRAATMFKCIQRIWMQANKLAELPVEFGNLRTLQVAEFEGNPLRSPPPDILAQGIVAIHTYLQKRIDRVEELKKLLASAQFEFHADHFTPQTRDLLHTGIMFLLEEDLKAFDKKVDHYVNGAFYENPGIRGVDLVQGLIELQFHRAQTSRKAVLVDVLKLCELIQRKRWLDKVEFRYDLTRPWGYAAEETPVYMLDPKALYQDWEDVPSILSVIKKRVERGFKEELFTRSRETVEDALNNYKGIYGPVGLATDNVPFRCGCEELIRKNKRHDPCYRFGWVIVQTLITPEEASRRQREQEHIAQALSQVRSEIESFCLNSRDGKTRLLKEAKAIKAERKKRLKTIKKQIPQVKRKIELRKADLDVAIKKHALDKSIAGEGWMEQDEKQVAMVEEVIRDEISQMMKQIEEMTAAQTRIKHELGQNYKHYVTEVVNKLLEEAGAEVRRKVIMNYRTKAARKQYRRPWDGLNGFDFLQFKQQYLGLPLLESPRDNSSVSDVSGDYDDFAENIDDDSDGTLTSIKSSSVSADDPDAVEEAEDAKKNSLNDAADADDSDDSDI